MSGLSGLGYTGSSPLKRSAEGIINTTNDESFPLSKLFNYPTSVIFSGRAISKLDFEAKEMDNCASIDIYANFSSGKKVNIFSINTNFFGRVQRDRSTSEQFKQYQVAPILYDSQGDSFLCDWFTPRTLPSKGQRITNDDILTSFDASYLLGYVASCTTHQFSRKFFNSVHEKLQLEIDVDSSNKWILNVCQTGKANHKDEIAEIRDIKYVLSDFICPITKKVMEEPFQDFLGNNYEKQAILKRLRDNPTSLLSQGIFNADMLVPNEELKQAITKYKSQISSSSSSLLPRLGPDGMRQLQAPEKVSIPVEKKVAAKSSVEEITEEEDEDDPLKCPLTLDFMNDPVMATDGHTYERAAIVAWINLKRTSPITSEPLEAEKLKPNYALKKMIQARNAKK